MRDNDVGRGKGGKCIERREVKIEEKKKTKPVMQNEGESMQGGERTMGKKKCEKRRAKVMQSRSSSRLIPSCECFVFWSHAGWEYPHVHQCAASHPTRTQLDPWRAQASPSASRWSRTPAQPGRRADGRSN